MNKSQAIESSVKVTTEIMSANPSALITLWELDITDLLTFGPALRGVLELRDRNVVVGPEHHIFRFHNNLFLTKNSISWKGNRYIPAPIAAEGFETSSKGTLPKPKLTLFASEDAIEEFSILKSQINLAELIGAKVTRIRTFAKYLDEENFRSAGFDIETSDVPEGFDPDPNAEFPRDIFYLDRKSRDTKQVLEFELSSSLDIENVKLPYRRVVQGTCQWQYRGEGCMYEYGGSAEISAIDPGNQYFAGKTVVVDVNGTEIDPSTQAQPVSRQQSVYSHIPYWQRNTLVEDLNFLWGNPQEVVGTMSNRNKDVHGYLGVTKLPIVAPPIANSNDELIFTIRNEDGLVIKAGLLEALPESEPELWSPDQEYQRSSMVFLQKDGVSYYFVAKQDVPRNVIPPNDSYWVQDECSKTIRGCALRWGRTYLTSLGMGHLIGDKMGNLPFGGFPAVNK
jgi:lambda family phage minor tail protein L